MKAPASFGTSSFANPANRARTSRFPIVVHSSVPWSASWGRAQQIHSRLAARHPVLFIEPPIRGAEADRLSLVRESANLWIAQPRLVPSQDSDDGRRTAALLCAERELRERFSRAAHWLDRGSRPEPVDLFPEPAAVVYDCEKDPGASDGSGAVPDVRENRLLSRADLVFTDSLELYHARRARHPRARFFGPGVEAFHFAATTAAELPPDLARSPAPRLGYVGVVDRRLDFSLLASLARRADWSIVLIGPLAGVAAEDLPPGVRLLGARSYEELPAYLSGLSVGLLPCVATERTRFLNPESVLQFLAAGKPVVSTPIPDVRRLYAPVAAIASADGFEAATVAALASPPDAAAGRELARRSSWERIVAEMELLVGRLVEERTAERRLAGQGWHGGALMRRASA